MIKKFLSIGLTAMMFYSGSIWAQLKQPVSIEQVYAQAEEVYDQWYASLRSIYSEYANPGYYGPNRYLISPLEKNIEPLSNQLAVHLYEYGALQSTYVIDAFLEGGNVNIIKGFLDQECDVQHLMKQKMLCTSSLIRYASHVTSGKVTTLTLEHTDFYTPCVKVGTMATCLEFVQQAGRAYILNTVK